MLRRATKSFQQSLTVRRVITDGPSRLSCLPINGHDGTIYFNTHGNGIEYQQLRNYSSKKVHHQWPSEYTYELIPNNKDVPWYLKWKRKKFSQEINMLAMERLFICCEKMVDYKQLVDAFGLQDNVHNYFKLLHMHMWMVQIQIHEAYDNEKAFLNYHDAMYRNVFNRMIIEKLKLMGKEYSMRSKKFEGIICQDNTFFIELLNQAVARSDCDLANAVWIGLLGENPKIGTLENLDQIVHYIRKQLHLLGNISHGTFRKTGLVPFLPLKGDEVDAELASEVFSDILLRLPIYTERYMEYDLKTTLPSGFIDTDAAFQRLKESNKNNG